MRDVSGEIENRGARLVIIGSGLPMHAQGFADKYALKDTVFTDPERSLYQAFGMTRSVGKTLGLGALKGGLRAFKEGFRQSGTQGDPWQQGGTLVISPQGVLVYEYLSKEAGDHAPVAQVLAALKA